MNEILFSVIIPAYNAEKYIKRSILSVLAANQKDGSYECIVINDGSTDLTKTICEQICEYNKSLILLSQENKGVSYARNSAINISKGKYILFLDADDYYESHWNQIVSKAIATNADYIFFDFNKITVEGKIVHICYYPNRQKTISRYEIDKLYLTSPAMNPCWSRIYKKSVIDDNKIYFNEQMNIAEDAVFSLNYWAKCHTFKYCQNSFLIKEEKNDSVMHRISFLNYLANDKKLYKVRKQYILANHLESFCNNLLLEHCQGLTNLVLNICYTNSFSDSLRKIDLLKKDCYVQFLLSSLKKCPLIKYIEIRLLLKSSLGATLYFTFKKLFIKLKANKY